MNMQQLENKVDTLKLEDPCDTSIKFERAFNEALVDYIQEQSKFLAKTSNNSTETIINECLQSHERVKQCILETLKDFTQYSIRTQNVTDFVKLKNEFAKMVHESEQQKNKALEAVAEGNVAKINVRQRLTDLTNELTQLAQENAKMEEQLEEEEIRLPLVLKLMKGRSKVKTTRASQKCK